MTKATFPLAVIAAFISTAPAQAASPNIAGTWHLDGLSSVKGRGFAGTMTVNQTGTNISGQIAFASDCLSATEGFTGTVSPSVSLQVSSSAARITFSGGTLSGGLIKGSYTAKFAIASCNPLNGDGDSGTWTAQLLSAPSPVLPTISPGAIVPLNSITSIIQPGSWITIYGNNFATAPATWKGEFPTSLAGVSVEINGKSAYLWYVSPGQINVQAPDDTALGTVPVDVTTPLGTATSTVVLAQFAPSLCLFDGKHVAGVIPTPDGSGAYGAYDFVGPLGTPFGFQSRPVKAGEVLEIYGIGFGPTDPFVPAGKEFDGVAPITSPLTVSIGGAPADVVFAGMTGAGLYQLNVGVPNTGSGDQLLQVTVGGVHSPGGIYVTVQ